MKKIKIFKISIFVLSYSFLSLGTPIEESNSELSTITLIPQVSLVTPNNLVLINQQFSVPYLQSMTGFPVFEIQIAKRVITSGSFLISVAGKLGYGYYQGTLDIVKSNGTLSTNDHLQMHWIPFSVSAKIQYAIPDVSFVRPNFEVGTGVNLIVQNESINGINNGFWIPVLSFAPSLTFFESDHKPGDWFGGFSFGMSFQTSFASKQVFNGWAFVLSQNIIL